MYRQFDKYFAKHVTYNSIVHLIIGIGVGLLITHPLADPHPVRWGLVFLSVGIVAHMYPLFPK